MVCGLVFVLFAWEGQRVTVFEVKGRQLESGLALPYSEADYVL